jgi:hypothetical protein
VSTDFLLGTGGGGLMFFIIRGGSRGDGRLGARDGDWGLTKRLINGGLTFKV